MVIGHLPAEVPVSLAPKTVDDHVVGTGPDPALPVTAQRIVLLVVCAQGWHLMRTGEFGAVREVGYQAVQAVLFQHIRLEGPEGADALGAAAAAVTQNVVQVSGLGIPHVLVDPGLEEFHFVFQFLDFLPALNVESDLHEAVVHQPLLQVGIQPGDVSVGEDGIVTVRNAGLVVHAGSPAAAPVGTVLPGAVQLPPLGIGHQGGEHAVQAVNVSELLVIEEFGPGEKVGAGAYGVVPFKAVRPVGPDFPADEAVLVLLGVEVVQGALEGEETVSVSGEHHHEGVVPHENVAVVCYVQIGRHETGAFLGLADIADGDFPGMPVHVHFPLVAFPEGGGKHFAGLFIRPRRNGFLLHGPIGILCHEDILHIRVLVRKVIGAALEFLSHKRQGNGQQEGGCGYLSHLETSLLMVRAISVLM